MRRRSARAARFRRAATGARPPMATPTSGLRHSRTCRRNSGSALARRLVEGLLHRRDQILEDRAGAEMDFAGHLHAWLQRVAAPVGGELLAREIEERAKGERPHRAVAA